MKEGVISHNFIYKKTPRKTCPYRNFLALKSNSRNLSLVILIIFLEVNEIITGMINFDGFVPDY